MTEQTVQYPSKRGITGPPISLKKISFKESVKEENFSSLCDKIKLTFGAIWT